MSKRYFYDRAISDAKTQDKEKTRELIIDCVLQGGKFYLLTMTRFDEIFWVESKYAGKTTVYSATPIFMAADKDRPEWYEDFQSDREELFINSYIVFELSPHEVFDFLEESEWIYQARQKNYVK
jgi:hypothetical protein